MSSEDESLADAAGTHQAAGIVDGSATIVDTVLDLDEALAGDVRRAERIARFCTEPWLQADLDALDAELAGLTDDHGRPLDRPIDAPLASGRDYLTVMEDYKAAHAAFIAAMRTVRVSALPPSAWEAFKAKWKKQIAEEQMSAEMRKELVVGCSIAPAISAEAYAKLFDRYGEAAMSAIGRAAWAACEHSGVDVPKSPVFSAAQRQLALSQS